MGVQASGTPPGFQAEGGLLAETLIDKNMWEDLCHRTKAKQVMVVSFSFSSFGNLCTFYKFSNYITV